MTEQPFPPRVPLNTRHNGHAAVPGAATFPNSGNDVETATPGVQAPAGGIAIMYYEDDPSDAVLVITMPDGRVEEVPLSEVKLARLRSALEGQAAALAQVRWEVAGGDPEDFVPDSADDWTSQDVPQAVEIDQGLEADDDDGLVEKAKRRAENLRDPLALGPVLDAVQKKDYNGVNVGKILLYSLLGLILIALMIKMMTDGLV